MPVTLGHQCRWEALAPLMPSGIHPSQCSKTVASRMAACNNLLMGVLPKSRSSMRTQHSPLVLIAFLVGCLRSPSAKCQPEPPDARRTNAGR
jgi:hypothetical protein